MRCVVWKTFNKVLAQNLFVYLMLQKYVRKILKILFFIVLTLLLSFSFCLLKEVKVLLITRFLAIITTFPLNNVIKFGG